MEGAVTYDYTQRHWNANGYLIDQMRQHFMANVQNILWKLCHAADGVSNINKYAIRYL